ncbi:hypothetical protein BDZ91DRAFT_729077 [Kalaharituber pfeilii]|nr:hypothetical protein BDZ91DRAFT_729077 [Kalaharituber pfeilii]
MPRSVIQHIIFCVGHTSLLPSAGANFKEIRKVVIGGTYRLLESQHAGRGRGTHKRPIIQILLIIRRKSNHPPAVLERRDNYIFRHDSRVSHDHFLATFFHPIALHRISQLHYP